MIEKKVILKWSECSPLTHCPFRLVRASFEFGRRVAKQHGQFSGSMEADEATAVAAVNKCRNERP